jgi:hypothetical protein
MENSQYNIDKMDLPLFQTFRETRNVIIKYPSKQEEALKKNSQNMERFFAGTSTSRRVG